MKTIIPLLLLLLSAHLPLSAGQSVIVGNVLNRGDRLEFTFQTTCPPGTNFQPQYATSLEGPWIDITDSLVLPTEGLNSYYDVVVPKFGKDAEFFRVIEADTSPEAPIAPTLTDETLETEDQILLLWNNQRASGSAVYGKLYGFAGASPDGSVEASLRPFPQYEFPDELDIGYQDTQDVLSVDLTGDGFPNPIMVWADSNDELQLVIPGVTGDGEEWSPAVHYAVPAPRLFTDSLNAPASIRIIAIELDGDDLTEFALAYTAENNRIHILTGDFDGDLTLAPFWSQPEDSQQLEREELIRSARFDIAAGNFDGSADGRSELALITIEPVDVPNGSENFRLFSRFFRADGNTITPVNEITPADTQLYLKDGRSTIWLRTVAAEAGDFDGDGSDELAIGFSLQNNSSQQFWHLETMGVNAAMDAVQLDTSGQRPLHQTSGDTGHPLSLVAFQVDNDPAEELLYAGRNTSIYEFDANLLENSIGSANIRVEGSSNSRRHVTFAQLESPEDPEAFDAPELVSIVEQRRSGGSGGVTSTYFTITAYRLTQPFGYGFEVISSVEDEVRELNNFGRQFSLVTAPFPPLDLQLGIPRRSTRIVDGVPTVIINAPPVHFDVIDGQEFDVNGIFPIANLPPQGSPFFARFSRTQSESVTVETQWQRSWDVSIKASGGFGIPFTPVQVEAEVRTKFGQDFNDYTAVTESTLVEVEIEAVDDDRLYATTLSYDIWEYPVVLNQTEVIGNVILIEPSVTRQEWFPSKSIVAQSFRPYHEVGNILSYRAVPEPFPGFEPVRPIVADTFTIGQTGGESVWKLTKALGETTTRSRTFNFAVGATASFDIPFPWVPDVEVSGDYSSSRLNSSTTTIADTNGLIVTLGTLSGEIGGATYSVTPYLYWSEMGALVLDYGVDIPLGTTNRPTFWREKYSEKPDPTFILPWRLDPEKGYTLLGDDQRLTRDIITLPLEPRPGEQVRVEARISNFSFLAMNEHLDCRFYLGDPAQGGQLIHETTVTERIEPRGKHLVKFDFTIPRTSPEAWITIYCVLDPDNKIDEIHENNNTAWNEIFLRAEP